MAGYGLEHTRSTVLFAHTCASVDAIVSYDRCDGINFDKQKQKMKKKNVDETNEKVTKCCRR